MNICFTYNVKHNTIYNVNDSQTDLEFDSIEVIEAIENALKSLGHTVIKVEATLDAYEKLKLSRENIDLVFNIAEGLGGDARESQIPLFCEMLEIPYTHSSPTTHAIKLHKHLTKSVLSSAGVNYPQSVVLTSKDAIENISLKFPLIVKPNREGSSKGIFNDSVVNNEKELLNAIDRILSKFGNEALVEEYIDGRELTVAMLGNPPKILPIIEQKFDFLPEGFNKVAGYELKWIYEDNLENPDDAHDCPAKLTKKVQKLVEETSLLIWNTLEVRDCARIDYRLAGDKLYFIEINTLPGINPDPESTSYFIISAHAQGLSFEEVINEIIQSALQRYK